MALSTGDEVLGNLVVQLLSTLTEMCQAGRGFC